MKETESTPRPYPLWLPYVAPMVAFMALTTIESKFGETYYPWLYCAKAVVVTAVLVAFREPWKDIRPTFRFLVPAVLVGLIIFAEWIWLPDYDLLQGSRAAFNPFEAIKDTTFRNLFLAVRFYGLVIMVPVMEEIFWRSFLLRLFSDPDFDFTKLPVGSFSWTAFGVVAFAFGVAHPEWLAAVICACAYALLLRQTKSLFACIVAHSVTNLALGIYVILTGKWHYW